MPVPAVRSTQKPFFFLVFACLVSLLLVIFSPSTMSFTPQSYGPAVSNAMAKTIATGAVHHAKKHSWNVAVAIVDTHGMLIYYEMMDDTQTGSSEISVEKAKTSARFRRPTKAFDDGVNGRTALLSFGVNMCEGGIPIVKDGTTYNLYFAKERSGSTIHYRQSRIHS